MPRRAIPFLIAAAALAPAATATAAAPSHSAQRKLAHDASESLCKQEHATKGDKQFRATYGAKGPTSVCIQRHLPQVKQVLASCNAQKASSGAKAFQQKWGAHGALRSCVLAGVSTTRPATG